MSWSMIKPMLLAMLDGVEEDVLRRSHAAGRSSSNSTSG